MPNLADRIVRGRIATEDNGAEIRIKYRTGESLVAVTTARLIAVEEVSGVVAAGGTGKITGEVMIRTAEDRHPGILRLFTLAAV